MDGDQASMRPGFYIPECLVPAHGACGAVDASMRPGFYIPECGQWRNETTPYLVASMRPGFYIPECKARARRPLPTARCFNEAGILHPGMRFGS